MRKIAITHRNRLKNQLNNAETSKIIIPTQEVLAFSSGGLNCARLQTDATVCVQSGAAGSCRHLPDATLQDAKTSEEC